MDFPALIDKYGFSVAATYLIVTDLFPRVIDGAKWLINKLTPERLARLKMEADQKEREDKATIEREEFERELHERDVIAKEQTAKALLLIDAHMQADKKTVQDQLALLQTSMITANQGLAVLLDRTMQRRATDIMPEKTN